MEFRGHHQEGTRTTPNSLGYGHLSLDSSGGGGGGERRRNGNGNGNDNNNGTSAAAISSHSQTLDHHTNNHHLQQLQQLNLDHPHQHQKLHAVSGAAISPVSARSDAKTPSRSSVRYRECLKNHAASIGGSVVDGCGEFMPCGENGTLEALTCAACNCHRNFHRKEVDGETPQFRRSMVVHPLQLPPTLTSPSLIHHQKFGHLTTINAPPMAVAYGGGGGGTSGGTESSSEELNNNVYDQSNNVVGEIPHQQPAPPFAMSKKRFRTRFTQEQKDKMMEFAEKVGWRIQKQYESELEKLCHEVGVKRQVLKVWMHNNKNNSLKKHVDQLEQEQEQPS